MERIKVTKLQKTGYGAGNLAFAVVFQSVSGFFYFYSTVILKLDPGIMGAILCTSVVWDAVTDPVMGYISDHTKSRIFGRRHMYLIAGALGTAVSNYLLWTINPLSGTTVKLISAAAYLLLCKTFLTVYTTPYNALGAEISDDYNERTSIQTVKTGFFIFGFLFPSIAGMLIFFKSTPIYETGQLNPEAYHDMGISLSLITLVFAAVCYMATGKFIKILPRPPEEKGSATGLYRDMFIALKNRDNRNIIIGYLFINITSALLSVIGMHVMTYTYGFDNMKIALIFGILFGTAILSQIFWTYISAKKEKKTAVLSAIILGIIGSLGFLPTVFFRADAVFVLCSLIIVAVVLGLAIGGCLSVPYSMLADAIDYDELLTGKRKEGLYYGTITFMYKFSQAIIVLFLGLVLKGIGFNADLPVQTPEVSMTIGLILPIGAFTAFIFSILFFKNYKLDKKRVEEIQSDILQKKNSQAILR